MPLAARRVSGLFSYGGMRRLAYGALALAPALACGLGDSEPAAPYAARAHPTGVKIALIGIDGASFDVLDPLVADGR